MAKVDLTEKVLKDIHEKTGFTGKKLEVAYLIFGSFFSSFIGDEQKEKHFDERLKNFKEEEIKCY